MNVDWSVVTADALAKVVETIVQRIADNNREGDGLYDQGNLDGRIEAYEDVLRILGFDDESPVDDAVQWLELRHRAEGEEAVRGDNDDV